MKKSKKIKVLFCFGTRPEVIKLSSVIKEIQKYPEKFNVKIVVSGQHRDLLDQALKIFKIKTDYDFNIMHSGQNLFYINSEILTKFEGVVTHESPDLVIVHGDTPTSFAMSLASFFLKIPVAHVEAGLRTYNKYNPFPEEINRQLIDIIADIYFAPTKSAVDNLKNEGKDIKNIYLTGNTAIDAAVYGTNTFTSFAEKTLKRINFKSKKVIFLTCHRRESWGEKMTDIFLGIKKVIDKHEDTILIFPVHPNPKIKTVADKVFGGNPRIYLTKPLGYLDSIGLINRCYLILTDSGGIQEEASYFKIPTLVLRNVTERQEGVDAGLLKVVGTNKDLIYKDVDEILSNDVKYKKMKKGKNPFGDGKASIRIRKAIEKRFGI